MKTTRFQCVICGKLTAGRLPRRGDTSARFPRRHNGSDGELCPGCFRDAVWVDGEEREARESVARPRSTLSWIEERPHERRPGRSAMGRTTAWITCPFCGEDVEAYLWSLAGSGKRCPGCGAVHYGFGCLSRRRVTGKNQGQEP